MSNVAKKIIKISRDKFLSNITESSKQINKRLEAIQDAQAQINRHQTELLVQLNNKITNSGTIQLSENQIMTKIFSGAKMYLDPRDIALVPHLVLDGEWEHEITQAWTSVLKPNDIVLDIGANFGYFGLLAAQLTNRTAEVILFEANPNLISCLQKTMEVNSFEGCSVIENLAVSDSEGEVRLNILKDYMASSSLHTIKRINSYNKVKQEVLTSVPVQATTLDVYCEKNNIKEVDLIKMDIEGFEEKAYSGMSGIVKASPKITLFIEFTKNAYDNPRQFYEQMLVDFGAIYLVDGEGNLVRPKRQEYNSVVDSKDANFVMLVFSKNKELGTKKIT